MSTLYKRMVTHEIRKRAHGSCQRKVPYQTERDAWAAIQQMVLDQNLDPEQAGHAPYKCPYCRYWHFTSKPRGGK
jgi:hypothetical protein